MIKLISGHQHARSVSWLLAEILLQTKVPPIARDKTISHSLVNAEIPRKTVDQNFARGGPGLIFQIHSNHRG
jgi:hypothetical protein